MSRGVERSLLTSPSVVCVDDWMCVIGSPELDSYRHLRGDKLIAGGSSDMSLYECVLFRDEDLAWRKDWMGVEPIFIEEEVEEGLLIGSDGMGSPI